MALRWWCVECGADVYPHDASRGALLLCNGCGGMFEDGGDGSDRGYLGLVVEAWRRRLNALDATASVADAELEALALWLAGAPRTHRRAQRDRLRQIAKLLGEEIERRVPEEPPPPAPPPPPPDPRLAPRDETALVRLAVSRMAPTYHLGVLSVGRLPLEPSIQVTVAPAAEIERPRPGRHPHYWLFRVDERRVLMNRHSPRFVVDLLRTELANASAGLDRERMLTVAQDMGAESPEPVLPEELVRYGYLLLGVFRRPDELRGPWFYCWETWPRGDQLDPVLARLTDRARPALYGLRLPLHELNHRVADRRALDNLSPLPMIAGWDEERCPDCQAPSVEVLDVVPGLYGCPGGHVWVAGQTWPQTITWRGTRAARSGRSS